VRARFSGPIYTGPKVYTLSCTMRTWDKTAGREVYHPPSSSAVPPSSDCLACYRHTFTTLSISFKDIPAKNSGVRTKGTWYSNSLTSPSRHLKTTGSWAVEYRKDNKGALPAVPRLLSPIGAPTAAARDLKITGQTLNLCMPATVFRQLLQSVQFVKPLYESGDYVYRLLWH
jgi:hypothetical protein